MSYKKKHKQADDEWRKKNFKGANIGPGGYQAHYVNNVINKYEKLAGKAKSKAAPAPAPAPAPAGPVHNLTGLVRRKGQPVAPPAPAPARDASPKRPVKRHRTHHAAGSACTVQVKAYTRKKPSCK